MRLDIDGGKYTLIKPEGEPAHVLRYGEPWLPELPAGANCWMAMAYEIEELREKVERLSQIHHATSHPLSLITLAVDAAGGEIVIERSRMERAGLRLTQHVDLERDCIVLRAEWEGA